jgi:glycosyltransferase involved in cell wall biosynthesis
MRIAIDATPIGVNTDDKGGVYHYILNLLLSLHKIDDDNDYVLFFNLFRKRHLKAFKKVASILDGKDNFKIRLSRFPQRIWRPLHLPINIFIGSVDIFHGLYSDLPTVAGCKTVVTVHDLRTIVTEESSYHEQWFQILKQADGDVQAKLKGYNQRLAFRRHRRESMPDSMKRADKIIAVSEYTKQTMMQTCNIPEEKIAVVYHGISSCFTPVKDKQLIKKAMDKYGIRNRYLLYVGKLDPLKNLERLLEAFAEIRKKSATLGDYELVLAGPKTWFSEVLKYRMTKSGLDRDIIMTDYVKDEDLPLLYSGAELFVFPSLFEGFGIPPLEAMACGCPVIASNVCSLPEVLGQAALFVNPYSVEEIVEVISTVLSNPSLRGEFQNKGITHAKQFSWEETAKRTLRVYKNL